MDHPLHPHLDVLEVRVVEGEEEDLERGLLPRLGHPGVQHSLHHVTPGVPGPQLLTLGLDIY